MNDVMEEGIGRCTAVPGGAQRGVLSHLGRAKAAPVHQVDVDRTPVCADWLIMLMTLPRVDLNAVSSRGCAG